MIDYLSTDSFPDIVAKNKQNIGILFGEFASGGISYKDLVGKVEANAKAATQAISDAAAAQATADEAKAKSLSNTNMINAHSTAIRANATAITDAVALINANAAAIARIINDGIGGYLGTYKALNGDDFTVLPQSANVKERAITEFPEADEIFYQEWEWKTPGGWTKLGSKTDSHIHSQSAGISLADVAAQQDPKIQQALTAAKKYTDDKFALYEEKEITITPAVYGWKTIADYATKQYTLEDIGKKVRITTSFGISSGLISATSDTRLPKINIHLGTEYTNPDKQLQLFYSSEFPTKIGIIDFEKTPSVGIVESIFPITKFEIWDIITPAVKATVLVKK